MIDIEGGPCGGKTTVKRYLQARYSDRIVFVPEVATMLLSGGFPVPGRDCQWSEEWQETFECAIFPLQYTLEQAYQIAARQRGINILVCDRGSLGGAPYLRGGVEAFCRMFNLNKQREFDRYAMVIHLESLAIADPQRYGSLDNECRFEPLERAQMLERETWRTWEGHRNHHFISGRQPIESKCRQAEDLVRRCLARDPTWELIPALDAVAAPSCL